MPSEVLMQILEMEHKSKDKTVSNIHAVAFAYGKALAMEKLLNMSKH